jgi:hypothetical protein
MSYHSAASMKLPNATHAVVDVAKLRDYCLNPGHARGRHKARVFASVLGIRREHAELLRKALLEAALSNEAIPGERVRVWTALHVRLFDEWSWRARRDSKHLDFPVE